MAINNKTWSSGEKITSANLNLTSNADAVNSADNIHPQYGNALCSGFHNTGGTDINFNTPFLGQGISSPNTKSKLRFLMFINTTDVNYDLLVLVRDFPTGVTQIGSQFIINLTGLSAITFHNVVIDFTQVSGPYNLSISTVNNSSAFLHLGWSLSQIDPATASTVTI